MDGIQLSSPSLNTGNNNAAAAMAAASAVRVESQNIDASRVQQVKPSQDSNATVLEDRTGDDQRLEAIKDAAGHVAGLSSFAVSDVRFTIYKEMATTGESFYVTRFTSLVDGKVTVLPEQGVFSAAGKESGTLLEAII